MKKSVSAAAPKTEDAQALLDRLLRFAREVKVQRRSSAMVIGSAEIFYLSNTVTITHTGSSSYDVLEKINDDVDRLMNSRGRI